MDDDDDDELLAAWRRGDRGAGERLFHRHFDMVRRFFVNKVHDDPEELIQKTFLACIEAKDRFEGRAKFSVYLLGIARNLLRRHWENRRTRGVNADIDDLSVADMGAGPSSIFARNQTEHRLLDALRRVSLVHQEILELSYWEQLTGPEMAVLLGMTEDGVRSRLRRAREELGKEYRRMERFAGLPESSDRDIECWAAKIRAQLDRGESDSSEDSSEEE